MKKFFIFFLLIVNLITFISAQETNLLDIDIFRLDSVFDEPLIETPANETEERPVSVISNLRRRGIEFDASYEFQGVINPGWEVYPWELTGEEHFSWALGIKMGSNISINAQISETFRVRSIIQYELPGFIFTLGDFFFDYNFNDIVFLRAGKYEQSWGISPNFGFTNLLSRVPDQVISPFSNSPSYIMKFDVPIGIGGLQLLAMTRADVTNNKIPNRNNIGFGAKYNLAYRWADFNFGLYYQDFMATRCFLSVKTTLWDIDFYNEWLAVFNNHTDNSFNVSFNLGFSKSFFDNKLEINGEVFYNGEESTFFYVPETEFRKEETHPFLKGVNLALNLLYRFDGKWSPRLFTAMRYASTDTLPSGELVNEASFSLIPGFRITPFPNLDVYIAMPVAVGKGYYFRTAENVKYEHRPLSLLLYVTFRGGVQASHYY